VRLHFASCFGEISPRAQQCLPAQCISRQPGSTSLELTLQVIVRLPIDRWEPQRAPKDNGQVFPRAQTETVILNRTVSSCRIAARTARLAAERSISSLNLDGEAVRAGVTAKSATLIHKP